MFSLAAVGALRKLEFKALSSGEEIAELIAGTCTLEELCVQECAQAAEGCFGRLLTNPPRQLTHLCCLDLTHNQLTSLNAQLFSDCLPVLHTLVLSHNYLTALPASLGGVRSLRVLLADHNRLQAFPESVAGLPLERLDLAHNHDLCAVQPLLLRAHTYQQCCMLLRQLSPARARLEDEATQLLQRVVRRHQIAHKFHRLVQLAKAHRSSADLLSLYQRDLTRRAAATTIQVCRARVRGR
jgi:Leucine rich repeat